MEKTFYIAGRYSRRLELSKYAGQLSARGWTCTADWLLGTHEAKDKCGTSSDHEEWAAWTRKAFDAQACSSFFMTAGTLAVTWRRDDEY